MKMESPTAAEVVALRTAVQEQRGIGITAAQDLCAEALHTSRRAWQQWETRDRGMHPAFWELACLKLKGRGKRAPVAPAAAAERVAKARAGEKPGRPTTTTRAKVR